MRRLMRSKTNTGHGNVRFLCVGGTGGQQVTPRKHGISATPYAGDQHRPASLCSSPGVIWRGGGVGNRHHASSAGNRRAEATHPGSVESEDCAAVSPGLRPARLPKSHQPRDIAIASCRETSSGAGEPRPQSAKSVHGASIRARWVTPSVLKPGRSHEVRIRG